MGNGVRTFDFVALPEETHFIMMLIVNAHSMDCTLADVVLSLTRTLMQYLCQEETITYESNRRVTGPVMYKCQKPSAPPTIHVSTYC